MTVPPDRVARSVPPPTDPRVLRAGYRECGRLTRQFGTTYFWGAALLPRRQRKHVYAVYALCRLADDIVDLPSSDTSASTARASRPSCPGPGWVALARRPVHRAWAPDRPGTTARWPVD